MLKLRRFVTHTHTHKRRISEIASNHSIVQIPPQNRGLTAENISQSSTSSLPLSLSDTDLICRITFLVSFSLHNHVNTRWFNYPTVLDFVQIWCINTLSALSYMKYHRGERRGIARWNAHHDFDFENTVCSTCFIPHQTELYRIDAADTSSLQLQSSSQLAVLWYFVWQILVLEY